MIDIRPARETDVESIRAIFLAAYGTDYAYPQYYDVEQLHRMVYADDTVLLVAEDSKDSRVVGTASVVFDIGAYADLVGEFGRLAVHPEARRRGIGKKLMQARIDAVKDRLHVGLVENRVAHPYSQRISTAHGFAAVGLLPLKLLVSKRESVALYVRYFESALELRKNNPRIIPEAHAIAEQALQNCGLPVDAIVDDESAPYPYHNEFEIDELTTQGYTSLLRFERGRVKRREIFGPMRLHYGLFQIQARHSQYLLARAHGEVVGAVGFTVDEVEKAARLFELISLGDEPVRFLLAEVERVCRDEYGVEYIDVDVNAHAPRMQRTLLELNYLPAAYVPALVFHEVERLDAIKMVRLLVRFDPEPYELTPDSRVFNAIVRRTFAQLQLSPRIAELAAAVPLFQGLNFDQIDRLAAMFRLKKFARDATIFSAGQRDGKAYLILAGAIEVQAAGSRCVGEVGPGECLGEIAMLRSAEHSATALATTEVEAAVLTAEDLNALFRRRPDIGVVIYRNLALGLGDKLQRSNLRISELTGETTCDRQMPVDRKTP